MPHIVVEYASELNEQLDMSHVMSQLFDATWSTGLFGKEIDIKVRAMAYDQYTVGNQTAPFIHVNARIMDGRTLEQRQLLSSALVGVLRENISDATVRTVDIHEVEKASYQKG